MSRRFYADKIIGGGGATKMTGGGGAAARRTCLVDINLATKPLFEGFQTASNKKVLVSEKSLQRSRKIFQEISEINLNANGFDEKTGKVNSEFKGFQTASNKKANISEYALAKSRKLLNEPYQEFEEKCSGYLNAYKGNTNTEFKGFQTASNKTVKISKAALERSRKIFQDIAEDNAIETDVGNIDTNKVNATFKGFQTASNKEVKVSAEALAKSKRMLQDIDEDSFGTLNMVNCSTVDANILPKFTGFQTASNKEVKVSSEAMAKSKKMFQDINDSEFVEIETSKHIADSNFKGFQTASNKEVIISEKAIANSKKILEDIEFKSLNADPREIKANTDFKFSGFQTANNKNVNISEEALVKSRRIFQDLDLDIDRGSIETCNYEKSKEDDIKVANKKTDVYALRHVTENIDKDTKISKSKLEINKYNDIIDDVDTQLLNNFEQSMHETTPKKSKRSGSPILSCPKAKRRKIFQIPYSQKSPKKTCDFIPPAVYHKPENMYNFNLTYKKAKIYTLKDLQKLETLKTVENNIDPYILNFNFDNIHQFEFTDSRNDITNTVLTLTELKNIFINSVNKKLIPDGWIDIQMKLILWKLMSYELKFPKTMSLTCTAKNVMDQLKYRFDKELYNAERPALRKILEKDDTPSKTLILCVAAICDTQDTSQLPELILTDGWYTIKTVIDKMLSKLVNNGKITVGTKLVIHGAELVGSEQAVSPWEDTSSLRLKIFGNSTRRARWDARLGYHGNGAILSQLSTVALDGGKVSKLRVFVARVYPALYVDKFEDGSTVTRSERLEHIHQMKFETETQALLEKIYEDVEKEVLDQDSQGSEGTSSGSKRKTLDSGSQIAKVMKRSRDPAEFRSHLTSTQTALLEDHTTREREILLQEIQTRVQNKMAALGVTLNRNVVTLLKVRVVGINEKSNVEVTRALLSIWRPNEAVVEMIKEGTWIEILNVVPTALRYSELQISAGRQSIFIQSKYKESEKVKPYTMSLKRTCYLIKDLVKNPAMTTDYNEIDTAGIIIEIDPEIDNFDINKHQFQNVYLADADKNIISVNFWGGLKKFGFENVLDTGQIVAGINLQKRAGNTRKNIPQYRVTEYSYFTKTPKSDTARKIIEELAQKLHKINKKVFYQECNIIKSNFSTRQTNENVTPYRFPNVDMNLSKNKIFLDSPLPQNILKKDENLNLTGLDFESTFNQTNIDQLSPRTLLRKQQVKERIAKLKRYGEPPPLSPIQMINKSKNAAKAYKSPLISKSDVSPSVASSEKKLRFQEKIDKDLGDAEIQCSPVISLNRTYVKRSNPVKLNFSKNDNSISETVDEFAEEFDSSPPLSLD